MTAQRAGPRGKDMRNLVRNPADRLRVELHAGRRDFVPQAWLLPAPLVFTLASAQELANM